MEEKLTEARERYAGSLSHSVVLGSQREEPYSVHPIVVAGPSGKSAEARSAVEKIKQELAECRGELSRLNAFIDNIQDKQTRCIFDLYYSEGLTWKQVAFRMGWTDESWPRKISKKYFEQSEKSDFRVL